MHSHTIIVTAVAAARVVAPLLQSPSKTNCSISLSSIQAHVQDLKATSVQTGAPCNLKHAQHSTAAISTLKPSSSDASANFPTFNMTVSENSCSIPHNTTDNPVTSTPSTTTNPGLLVAAAAAANNPVLLAQMRNWKLDQLGKSF